jgi:hypothetical protein
MSEGSLMKHIWHGSLMGASVSERIKGTRRFIVILVWASVMPCLAVAGPILSFEYVGSGQIVSPTSLVVVQGRITNSGDSDIVSAMVYGSAGISQPAYNQYGWASGGYPKLGPTTFVNLAAGASITWTIETFQTWPITGNRGDPVPAGTYFLTPGNFSTYYSLVTQPLDPATGQFPKILVQSATSNFEWTVTSNASVPEPESWALLGGGLIALLVLVFANRIRRLVR